MTKGMVKVTRGFIPRKIQWHIHTGWWSLVNWWHQVLMRHYIRGSWILMRTAIGLMDGTVLMVIGVSSVIPRNLPQILVGIVNWTDNVLKTPSSQALYIVLIIYLSAHLPNLQTPLLGFKPSTWGKFMLLYFILLLNFPVFITARKRSCGKVMFLHLSVILFTVGVTVLEGESLSKGSLSRGVSIRGLYVQGDLCPKGSLSRGLCPGGLCPGGISVRDTPLCGKERAVHILLEFLLVYYSVKFPIIYQHIFWHSIIFIFGIKGWSHLFTWISE